jgi:hypothetical protein
LEIMMLDGQFNRIHSGAVCKEIGERLPSALGPQPQELPAPLIALIEQLAKVETSAVPPLVSSARNRQCNDRGQT